MTEVVEENTPAHVRGPNQWNRSLPYADTIPEEASAALEAIKRGLSQVAVTRQIIPGLKFWCQRLEQ